MFKQLLIIVEHTVYWCQMENQIIKEPTMISSGNDKQFPRFPVDKRVVTPKKKENGVSFTQNGTH